MVRRRALVALGWAVVTASAVAIASLAVSNAVANVADPLPAMISGSSSAASAPAATSTTATVVDTGVSTTVAGQVDGSPASAGPSSEAPPPPAATGVADPVAVEHSDDSAAPPPPAATTQSFRTNGGVVTMSCDGHTATLVSATPASNYTVKVANSGPEEIEVAFTSASHDSEFHGTCVNGQPTQQISDD